MTAGRDRLAHPALVVGAAAARRGGDLRRRRRPGGRPADGGRGVRGRRRPRLARLPGPHRPHRGDVRAGRAPVLLLHLRHALVRERRVRPRRGRRRRAAARRRGRRRARRGPRAGGRPRGATPTWPAARPGWPAVSAWAPTHNGVDLFDDASPVRLESCARAAPARGAGRPARRHQRRRGPTMAVLAGRRALGVGVPPGWARRGGGPDRQD